MVRMYKITSYGAKSGDEVMNTAAIQRALDDCHRNGGGTVRVPAGKFVTGSLTLKSNTTLDLEAGAVLMGSPAMSDYPSIGRASEKRDNALIVAIGAENIAITGRGVIDGNGKSFIDMTTPSIPPDFDSRHTRQGEKYLDPSVPIHDGPMAMFERPGVLVLFIECKNIVLRDFTVHDAPNWNIHLAGCEAAHVQGLNIFNNLLVPNADGMDISNCRNVNISHCNIETGDDGIAFSPCADGFCNKVCENINVSNCTILSRSAAIRIGYGCNDIRNLTFQNIIIRSSNRAIGIFVREKQNIENVLFSNIIIETRLHDGHWWGKAEPIHISAIPLSPKHQIGRIKNIRFAQLLIRAENGIVLYGEKAGHIQNVSLKGIHFFMANGALNESYGGNIDLRPVNSPTGENFDLPDGLGLDKSLFKHDVAGFYARHAENLQINDFELAWDESLPDFFTHGIWLEHSREVKIANYKGDRAPRSLHGKPIEIVSCMGVEINPD